MSDWPALVRNLAKAQAVWRILTRIISREGTAPRVYGFLFKAVVKSVLLLGAETWVATPCMGRVLGGGFQYKVAQRFMGRLPRRRTDEKWEYTLELAAREEAVLESM